MPAPPNNTNAAKHWLTLGSLPPGAGYIKRITASLRDAVERAVVDAKGEIGLVDAAVVQTLIRWERHALLAQKWLRNEIESLSPSDKIRFSAEIARASAERDKCFARLGIDKTAAELDPWANIFDLPPPAPTPALNASPATTAADSTTAAGVIPGTNGKATADVSAPPAGIDPSVIPNGWEVNPSGGPQ